MEHAGGPAHPPRFLCTTRPAAGVRVRLDRDEARHARVRRLAPGDRIVVFDGRGHSALAEIVTVDTRGAEADVLKLLSDDEGESPVGLTLAIALLKAEKLELVIEKTTELGIVRIVPFASAFSLGNPSPTRRERWQKIAVSAAKQSGRTVVPEVAEPVSLATLFDQPAACRVLFWEGASGPNSLCEIRPVPRSATLIVGPEGGFAPEEVTRAKRAGTHVTTLGPRILRAETAAIAAVTLAQYTWGDLAAHRS